MNIQISLFIKYFFITACSSYSFFKLNHLSLNKYKLYFKIIFFSLLTTSIFTFIIPVSFMYRNIFLYFIQFGILSLTSKNTFYYNFKTSLISYSISFLIHSIATLLFCTITAPFLNNPNNIILFPYQTILGLSGYIAIILLFKIKRFKNGMSFLTKNKFIDLSLVLGIILLGYNTYLKNKNIDSTFFHIIAFIFLLFLAIALFIWWRRKLTQSYVEKLRVSEVETLYKEISDRDLEIEKLHAHNAQLGQIIHKDNKLIPAMELAVRSYLQTAALMKPEEAKQMGAELLAKLERMSADRAGIVRTYKENNTFRQRTGVSSIDAIVDFMENKASTLGIEYHYQFDKGIKEKLPAYINEDDTMHLLSEISDNAIIASTYSNEKFVHVHIGFIQDMLFIDISDSGIPFTPETYQNWGMLQHTTHGNHGGSGIGLMDLAKLKKQYKFSLQIYEYPPSESVYTKKIRILFDKKNHYLIQSYRAREIRSTVMRNDLHVLQYVDTEKITTLLEEKSKRAT